MTRLLLLAVVPLMLVGNLLAWLRFIWAWLTHPARAWRIAVGIDQLVNVAANGHEDETLSSRAGKAAREGQRWACVLCRLLDRLDPNHCEKAIEPDEGKPLR